MDEIGSKKSTRIGVLPLPGFALLSYASLTEPLRAANLLSRKKLYEVVNIGDARSSGGMRGDMDAQVGSKIDLDYLFVVAGGDPLAFNNKRVFNWLHSLARQGVVMGGVSGGPVVLAKAGLMEGRRMTVHWEHGPALSEADPNLLIERSLYVIDRDRITCAGGTAPLDMIYALITQDHGSVFAQLVNDWFLHTEVRPSGGPQRGGLVERVGTTSRPVLVAVEAMESHVADPLTLGQLATLAGVSVRQLSRLFEEKLQTSPMVYYRDLRLDVAERLAIGSSISLTEVALAAGFANSAHFSKVFSDRFGFPPSKLRR